MNPFFETRTVAFELSNTCPLAAVHARCPLHLNVTSPFRLAEVKHLPAELVRSGLDALARHGYEGEINFHQYNEPLVDPRLFELVRYARESCPRSEIMLLTNGLYLSRQLALELRDIGVTGIWITLYGSEEDRANILARAREEIIPLFAPQKTNVYTWLLDDRMENYDREYLDRRQSCHAPLCTLVITCDGDLGLCCHDWRRQTTFGSLRDKPLDELVMQPRVRELYGALRNGNRTLDLCRRCKSAITPLGKA